MRIDAPAKGIKFATFRDSFSGGARISAGTSLNDWLSVHLDVHIIGVEIVSAASGTSDDFGTFDSILVCYKPKK